MKYLKLIFALSLFAVSAKAHFEVLNTAPSLKQDSMRALFIPQILTSNGSGLNLSGAWDYGYSENSDFRISLGLGEIDFSFGGSYKYNVYREDQTMVPSFSVLVGTYYSNTDGSNEFSIRGAPLVSKNFNSELGLFTPFASLPVSFTARSGDHFLPIHLVFGTEWKRRPDITDWYLMSEIGFNLNDTFSYISFAAVFSLDKLTIVSKDRNRLRKKFRRKKSKKEDKSGIFFPETE